MEQAGARIGVSIHVYRKLERDCAAPEPATMVKLIVWMFGEEGEKREPPSPSLPISVNRRSVGPPPQE